MTASLSIAPVAAAKLAALRLVIARELGVSLTAAASLRTVHPAAELVSVSTVSGLSQCCGHAPDRGEGEDCGCQDVRCRLTVRRASIVKGGKAREIKISGDVTLAGGTFQGQDWSWCPMFAKRVEALGLDIDEVEDAIESDA
jgi:hypothetical protein